MKMILLAMVTMSMAQAHAFSIKTERGPDALDQFHRLESIRAKNQRLVTYFLHRDDQPAVAFYNDGDTQIVCRITMNEGILVPDLDSVCETIGR